MAPIRNLAGRILPKPARRQLVRWVRRMSARPRVGAIQFGDLRRLRPISADWGFERGEPVDRFYIRQFLTRHAADVRGRVLEVANNDMTRLYGGGRVTRSDVLHVSDSGRPVTIVADLSKGAEIPSRAFDCIILTQTMHFIYDVAAVVRTLHRVLKPGGTALVTMPGIPRLSAYEMDRWGHYWCFTTKSARRLFEEEFAPEALEVEAFGNVFAAIAFLHGVAADELRQEELLHCDPDFQTLVTVRAVK